MFGAVTVRRMEIRIELDRPRALGACEAVFLDNVMSRGSSPLPGVFGDLDSGSIFRAGSSTHIRGLPFYGASEFSD